MTMLSDITFDERVQPAPSATPDARPPEPDHTIESGQPERRTLWTWLQRHAVSIIVLAAVLTPLAVIHAIGMSSYPVRFDDEGTYVSQAWALLQRGELSPYTYWYDHPPFGWMQLAGYFAATGAMGRADTAILAGREAMLFVQLISSGLLFVLCRRLQFARVWAVAAVALFTLSPLALNFHRMVLLDNLAMPWLLGAFVLALTPRHRLGAYAGAALCFAAAVLTKTTMAVFLPVLVYQIWQNTDFANRRYAWAMFAPLLVLSAGLYPVYALINGEFFPGPDHVSLVEATLFQLGREPGDASTVISDWLALDQLFILVGAAAVLPGLAIRRLRPYAVMGLICLAIVLRPGWLPIPFVVAVFAPAAVLIAGVLDTLSKWRVGTGRLSVAPAAVAGAAAVALALVAGPSWAPGIRSAMNDDTEAPMRAAQDWVLANVSTSDWLLVDNAIWTDLVEAGLSESQVIWFYKIDLDPVGVGAELEAGPQQFNYVVSTRTVRDDAEQLPNVQAALDESTPVAVFGSGKNRVEVRRVHPVDMPRAGESDRQFVVGLYQDLLGREPETEGLIHWMSMLDRGEVTREELIQVMSDSPEHLERLGLTS
jgi:hypothetical protein